jgi:acetate kinase
VANSFGTTPQSGLPHNNRVGDFDAYALLKALPKFGLTFEQALAEMARNGWLLGISGVSNDHRDVEEAAAAGNERAKLALDVLVESVRHYVGAYLAVLNGADLLVTGGIGGTAWRSARRRAVDYAGSGSIRARGSRQEATPPRVREYDLCDPDDEELRSHARRGCTRGWKARR